VTRNSSCLSAAGSRRRAAKGIASARERSRSALEAAIAKLDKFHLLILDDIAYVTKDQAETSVLFELISARYERRSLLITANQPFGEWGKIEPDSRQAAGQPGGLRPLSARPGEYAQFRALRLRDVGGAV
jgi:hypothetical protein